MPEGGFLGGQLPLISQRFGQLLANVQGPKSRVGMRGAGVGEPVTVRVKCESLFIDSEESASCLMSIFSSFLRTAP